MKILKILIISPGYPGKDSIDFVFVEELCKALVEKNFLIEVIAPQSLTKQLIRRRYLHPFKTKINSRNGSFYLHRPLYITFGTSLIFRKLSSLLFNLCINFTVRKLSFKPNVCYGHFWHSSYAISRYAIRRDIPLFVASGEEDILEHFKYTYGRIKNFLQHLNGVIAVSTKVKCQVLEENLVPEEKCIVIPNSINPNLFKIKDKNYLRERLNFPKDDFIVIFVGQFSERKGITRLDNALKTLNNKNIKAIYIGTGSERPDYCNTLFSGKVQHDDLPDYLNCADVFCLPTTNEGCSNAIIEALACGLPVISADLPFNHDILNHSNSILINPLDVQEIGRSISYLYKNPEKRKKMSEIAFKSSLELSLNARVDKITEFIRIKSNRQK